MAVGQAEEFGEGVVRVDAHAHRVGVGGCIGPAESVTGAGFAGGRIREPCVGTRRIHKLADREFDSAGTLLSML
jgi:hypothetical protein